MASTTAIGTIALAEANPTIYVLHEFRMPAYACLAWKVRNGDKMEEIVKVIGYLPAF